MELKRSPLKGLDKDENMYLDNKRQEGGIHQWIAYYVLMNSRKKKNH
jgi:hypothetical protein